MERAIRSSMSRLNLLLIGTLGLAAWTAPASAQIQAGRGTDLAPIERPDGVTVGAEGPSVDVPWIIGPRVRGEGGVQFLHTVRDDAQFLLRLGAGYAAAHATGVAPPLQLEPGRRWNIEGSAGALRHDGGEFYASMERRQWGPGWTGSLILDAAAPPLVAVGWRRAQPTQSVQPWLRWMGPWSADVFFGRLFGHAEPTRPALIGMRVQVQPFENFQLGLSRTMQWGGGGRQENLPSLLRGLVGWDNVGTHGITTENQPGNQLGVVDWRLSFGPERQWALYGQAVGEDENGHLPSAYIVQLGFDSRIRSHGAELIGFIEWNDLIAGHAYGTDRPPGITYTSSVYPQGYTHDRFPLGHPAGGDVQLASAGVIVRAGPTRAAAVVSRGEALPTAQRFAAGIVSGFNGSVSFDIDAHQQLGAALWWWRDSAELQRAGQVWWRWAW